MNLVEVKSGKIFCDSQMIAQKFNQKHNHVVSVINKLINDLRDIPDSPKTPVIEAREYRGRKYTAYLMEREFYSLLAMRFKGKMAIGWQVKFNNAFYDMEKQLLSELTNKESEAWLDHRKQGKQIRQETTDIISAFVDYATEQGSKSAKFYYKHITNATYRALGLITQSRPKLRDTLGIMELNQISTAEYVAQRSLRKHMADGIPYKKIYDFVKDDLNNFADSLFLGEIKQKKR